MNMSIALLLDFEYFDYKKEYINEHYIITHYLSCDPNCIGKTLDDKIIIDFGELLNIHFDKIIIALPLTPIIKRIITVLFRIGTSAENIILLFDKPHFYKKESIYNTCPHIAYKIHTNGDIISLIDDCMFLVSTDNELHILKEIFAVKCYDFFIPESNIIVIDIGMNIGVASVYFAKKEYVDKIYAFEPFPVTYDCAIANITLNHVTDKIIPHPYGLDNATQDLMLTYNEDKKGFMSTTYDNLPYSYSNETIPIKVMDVAEVFQAIIDKHNGGAFVFKIDCEGAEYNILERLSETGLLRYIKLIIMEWHKFDDYDVSHLEFVLQQNHFTYHVLGVRSYPTGMLYAVNSHFSVN